MFWIILIALILILIVLIIKFRRPKDNTIILFSGANGSGKSFNMTCDSLRLYKRSLREWERVNKPFFIRLGLELVLPGLKKKRLSKELYGIDKPRLYSTYPIKLNKKEISIPISNNIMLLMESIPLNSIVVIDEFSSWINQFQFKESFSDVLNDHIQKWRHYHGNKSHLLVADQCTNNIPIQVRYRCNQAICCKKTMHYWFVHITNYKCIDLSDDIKNVEIVDNNSSDTEDKILKMIRISFGRKYDDRAYSNRYSFVDGNVKHSKYIESRMKVDILMPTPNISKDYKYLTIDEKIEMLK